MTPISGPLAAAHAETIAAVIAATPPSRDLRSTAQIERDDRAESRAELRASEAANPTEAEMDFLARRRSA